jgi:cell division protein FtsW (lipid II flippase)
MENTIDVTKLSYNIDAGRHILFIAVGFLLMITVYFLDYTIIGKYPKVIWFILLVGFFLYAPFGVKVNGQFFYLHAYGLLLIPFYGGILYAYRNKGYIGIIKCLLFSIAASMIELQFVVQSSVYLGLIFSSLIMLSVAVMKNWFGTSKRKAMTIIWGWIPITFLILILSDISIFGQYQIMRLQSMIETILNPELYPKGYQMNIVRQAISQAKLFGGSTDLTIGYLPGINNDYILTYVIHNWGIAAGMLIISLFIIFIGRMIYVSMKQKNSLGMFVGLGCSLVFAIQGSIYILSNLGIQFMAQVNLPFVSYGSISLYTNFIVLGILLSVFRNTNIIKEVPYKKITVNIERVK